MKPWGLLYWVRPDSSTDGGFTQNIPTGFSDIGGLSPVTYPNWGNYTKNYASMTDEDMLESWADANYFTSFKMPIPHNNVIERESTGGRVRHGLGSVRRVMVTTWEVVKRLKALKKYQNENIGNDLDWAGTGAILFQGNPVVPVPYLDTNAGTGTAWGINPHYRYRLGCLPTVLLEGRIDGLAASDPVCQPAPDLERLHG